MLTDIATHGRETRPTAPAPSDIEVFLANLS